MKIKENKFSTISILFLCLFVLFNNIYAQEDTIRIDTNLITVPLTVLDREGRYLSNLKKPDFQIFENGIEQEIVLFEPAEKPITVLFVLDVSSSMLPHKENLLVAINAFASQLHPNDQVMVSSFFQWTNMLVKPTKVSEFQTGFNLKMSKSPDCPTTYLYNAVDNSLDKIEKIRGRKAIILFSDGIGDGWGISAEDTLRKAEEQEALIYAVQFGTFPSEPSRFVDKKTYFERIEKINGYMQDIAIQTGGRRYHIEDISNLEETFKKVAEELRQQYRIGYYPKESGKQGERRQIKVKVNVPNAAVRARNSYIVGANK